MSEIYIGTKTPKKHFFLSTTMDRNKEILPPYKEERYRPESEKAHQFNAEMGKSTIFSLKSSLSHYLKSSSRVIGSSKKFRVESSQAMC